MKRSPERPRSFLQQEIDEVIASLSLGVVVGVGLRSRSVFRFGHLRTQSLQLLIECSFVGEQCREVLVLFA